MEAQSGTNLSPRGSTADVKESQELKEAMRAQMEVQRRLHEQVEVQKHMQIRMEANQKYIDTILDKAFKIVSEQLSGFSISDQDLPDLASAGVMFSSTDPLSPSVFHQLSVSSVSLHSLEEAKPFRMLPLTSPRSHLNSSASHAEIHCQLEALHDLITFWENRSSL